MVREKGAEEVGVAETTAEEAEVVPMVTRANIAAQALTATPHYAVAILEIPRVAETTRTNLN